MSQNHPKFYIFDINERECLEFETEAEVIQWLINSELTVDDEIHIVYGTKRFIRMELTDTKPQKTKASHKTDEDTPSLPF